MNVTPVLLKSSNDCGQRLLRAEVTANDSKSELWLQELLYRHPELLPVEEFDEAFGFLIPVARELSTPRGPIDNLYVTASGGIVIVETKLWKNPEKHRTVVAQILDYAKELATWDYDRLAEAVLACSRSRKETERLSLDEKVAPFLSDEGTSSSEFQESILASLAEANFLLLIVGDRISPNITLLTQAIHSAPGLNFTLGLVEMRLYTETEGNEWPLIVVPDIVGRTVEKTRGVVRVLYKQEKPNVAVEVEIIEPGGEGDEDNLDLDLFLDQIPSDLAETYRTRMDQWRAIGGTLHITPKNIYWRMFLNGGERAFARCNLRTFCVLRQRYYVQWGIDAAMYQYYVDALKQSAVATNTIARGRMGIPYAKLPANDLAVLLDAVLDFASRLKKLEQ